MRVLNTIIQRSQLIATTIVDDLRYDDLKLDPNGDDIVTAEELQQALPNYLPFEQYVKQLMEEKGSLKGRHSENMFFFPNTETDGIIQRVTERVAQVVGVSRTLINKSDIQASDSFKRFATTSKQS